MLKKLIAIIISSLIICYLCSCDSGISAPQSSSNPTSNNSSMQDSSDTSSVTSLPQNTSSDDTITSDTSTSSNTVTSNNSSNNSSSEESKKENSADSSSQEPIINSSTNASSGKNDTSSSPETQTPITPPATHTPLSKNSYYRYSSLNQTEKNIYNNICDAIENTENVVSLEKYNIKFKEMWKIYEYVIADNPQYFWVTKFLQYTHSPSNNIIIDLFLFYTDGNITDEVDEQYNLITIANRDKIKSQINTFNTKVKSILATIPATLKDIEKEKLIHDYILKNVTYDYSAVGKSPTRENYPRVYDSYGAICEGKSVCEGYTRMFQYLCYQVGINANFVRGKSNNQDHAWNIIKLDDDWYHVDTTWDDGSTNGLMLYTYFNLTNAQIGESHVISSNLPVPNATSTKYSFISTFGMNAVNLTSTPQNYAAAIDAMVEFNDSHLIIKLNSGTVNANYVQTYFLDSNSDIQKYITSKNYAINFENSYYYTTDDSGKPNYLYIKKK